ncbi:hypothetical protein HDV04_004172 [Boothiomyces sp. JEL0838]|nr:hypothetical protein HDV04_004172 [Boothiomyces sp. JEL0838]
METESDSDLEFSNEVENSLKIDHGIRPLWINEDYRIILEAFSPIHQQAEDLLLAIAEPISRPARIHEYKLTTYSLYAAVSVGLNADTIIEGLEKLCKTEIPDSVLEFIKSSTSCYGKVRLILVENRYFVECVDDVLLDKLLGDADISSILERSLLGVAPLPNHADTIPIDLFSVFDHDIDLEEESSDGNMEERENTNIITLDILLEQIRTDRKFEIKKNDVETLKKKCAELSYPMLEEYDFHADHFNPHLALDLKPNAKLRSYQEKSLGKMFGNGRARSGIIVLPCGAGKTLVGVQCQIDNSLSVEQWTREFKYWTTIKDSDIAKFSSECKQPFEGDAGVLISTYTMLTHSGNRAYDAQNMLEFIKSREWGFLLMDEVHVVPADMFKKTLTIISSHAKLGLTATLVREDEKIHNLNWLIGPKLFEANWMELASLGYIANVQCNEVWCDMTKPFYREYLRQPYRQLLYTMNPNKIKACQYLIAVHEAMGDKIIVFSDNHYAEKLQKPYLYGGTSQSERIRLLQQFRFNPALNTIFLSKIGDTSIDIPEATCLIQISSHFGSRRQEAQRLGRILRPKKNCATKVNAYFYTLVSKDTEEMYYATKRQQFLIDQGYEFKIITNIQGMEDGVYQHLSEELSLLNTVLLSLETQEFEEGEEEDEMNPSFEFTRLESKISSLSGGDSMAYMEFRGGTSSGLDRRERRNNAP